MDVLNVDAYIVFFFFVCFSNFQVLRRIYDVQKQKKRMNAIMTHNNVA